MKIQYDKLKVIFTAINNIITSTYYKKRCVVQDNSQKKKRVLEREKRELYQRNPSLWHRCERCDSIFPSKCNLVRHQQTTLKCSVIKNTKKGVLDIGNHRSVEISNYIANHIDDDNSDEDAELTVEEQQELANLTNAGELVNVEV